MGPCVAIFRKGTKTNHELNVHERQKQIVQAGPAPSTELQNELTCADSDEAVTLVTGTGEKGPLFTHLGAVGGGIWSPRAVCACVYARACLCAMIM